MKGNQLIRLMIIGMCIGGLFVMLLWQIVRFAVAELAIDFIKAHPGEHTIDTKLNQQDDVGHSS